jgi:hypothetical protein
VIAYWQFNSWIIFYGFLFNRLFSTSPRRGVLEKGCLRRKYFHFGIGTSDYSLVEFWIETSWAVAIRSHNCGGYR